MQQLSNIPQETCMKIDITGSQAAKYLTRDPLPLATKAF
jgi:hypothetical protein